MYQDAHSAQTGGIVGYDTSIRSLMQDIRGTAMTRINAVVADANGQISTTDQLNQMGDILRRVQLAEEQTKKLYIKLSRICGNM